MLLSAVTFAPLAGALVITLFKMFSRAEDSAFIEKNARPGRTKTRGRG